MIANSLRENEDILRKLERFRDICSNIRENIERIIMKYYSPTTIEVDINPEEMLEDINFISFNLNMLMKLSDPIFKHYLALPFSVENENSNRALFFI
jgi:hypothetical protein